MNRIEVLYGGQLYTLPGTDLDAAKQGILDALALGEPSWLRVNHGQGNLQPADLLIRPGIEIAVLAIPEPDAPAHSSHQISDFDPEDLSTQ